MPEGVSIPEMNGRSTFDYMGDRAFERVSITVHHHRPFRCPVCGDAGPFHGTVRWMPVLISGDGEVDEVLDYETIWADLEDDGPGLQCRVCHTGFVPQPTIFEMPHP